MKFYVTGRSNNCKQVKEVCERIKAVGHEITFEWTELPMVKPYPEHTTEAAELAQHSTAGMVEADVHIFLASEDGNGVYTELGSALTSQTLTGTPRICAVGRKISENVMFTYHPGIEWFETIEDIYKELEI